jgi:hypothetical protein
MEKMGERGLSRGVVQYIYSIAAKIGKARRSCTVLTQT